MTQLHSTRGPGRLYNFSSYSKSLKFSKCVHIKIQLNCLISCRLRGSSNEVGNISIHINFTKKKKMIRTILGFFNFQRFFSSNYGKSNGTWKCVMPSTRCSFNKRNKKCLLNPKRNTAINIFQDEIIKNTLLFWCELLKMPLIVHIIITLSTG